ncbi:hypothetical protein HME9302_01763 [Alteripontixanthobacter maritimus]|uniref:Type I restriction enzyme R protein N-terminal domain-containing protein n=1 Tax=Alteripontixanthobacter maritimus TaxID=2161824 RepID=A0A369Q7W9_9SPHN|nr:type I restriction endonuclease [Alteripontixanthobacter maritimus]RDC60552.1 hypothetical protein HME9302_01763 [Alteripontixanthobacter maritimus]
MEFESEIGDLQSKLREHRDILKSEEAAKTTLVLPFLRALGYDIFDPSEVEPEFTCDVGTKKGEKVDYAIHVNGELSILVECKPANSVLSSKHASQLFRYFATTDAKVALLTNGLLYNFYTDGDRTNRMDDKPFFTFNLEDHRKSDLKTLRAFRKADFNLEQISAQAGTLKLQSEVSAELRKEFDEPSDEFVRMIANRLHEGRLTQTIRSRFKQVITQSIVGLIRDGVNERLESAISQSNGSPSDTDEPVDFSDIETTQSELDGFNIVRAIASQAVAVDRVILRDAKSYCAILLDDNNRRTIARLHFNSPTARHLGVFEGKQETRLSVENPTDIYSHADQILTRIRELETENNH